MIKIVLIGCGEIAMFAHLPALTVLRNEGLVQIAGVCDVDLSKAKSAASNFDVANYGVDWEAMVEESFANVVSICLPPGPNAEISARAIELGLHVICEKPPGRNVAQAEKMALAASRHPNLVNMIAFNRRFTPLYVKAIKYSIELGEPHVFYGRFTRPSLGGNPSNTAKDWITSDASHTLDLAIATIGFPNSVAVAREQVGNGPDNVWTIQLHSDRGSAVLLFDFAAGRRVERFEWSGPGYDVLLELPERGEWSHRGEAVENWIASELTQTTDIFVNYGFLDEYRYFINAVVGSAPKPHADFAYGASFMQLVKTILECPSGELHKVPKLSDKEYVDEIEDAQQQKRPIGLVSERPVVKVMQLPSAQVKYFDLEQLSHLAVHCDLHLQSDDNQSQDITDADVVITGWGATPLSSEELMMAQRLKLLIVIGASMKAVQPEQLLERNVILCNTADAIAQSVAEHCLLVTLAGLKHLTEVDRQMHLGGWSPDSSATLSSLVKKVKQLPPIDALKPLLKPIVFKVREVVPVKTQPASTNCNDLQNDLQGQLVGLIGWGHVARHFARLLQPFNCRLLIFSEFVSKDELEFFNAKQASLGEVLGAAKVISLHKGLSNQSQGMIGARELALIQPGSVLVNTARAALINEEALIARAQLGDIVVALDVFEQEPLPSKNPLRQFNNVILSPHNSSSTVECYRRVGKQALDILLDWLAGKPIAAIDSTRLAKMT